MLSEGAASTAQTKGRRRAPRRSRPAASAGEGKLAGDVEAEGTRLTANPYEAEPKLQAITEGMPSLLWALGTDGRCEFVNKRCASYLGVTEQGCVGLEWNTLLHPDDREVFQQTLPMPDAAEVCPVRDFRLRRHDGAYRWFVHRRSVRRDSTGRLAGWIGVSDDISTEKEREVTQRQTETLAAMGRMASTLSHEINNPLSAVTNVLFLLERNPSLDEKAREYLETAQQQLARVTEATREQLQFQQHATETEQINVAETVQHLLALCKPRLESKHVDLKTRTRGDTWVQCYEMEIRQALRHVLHNALDAVPVHGRLRVRVRDAQRPGPPAWEGVRVTIAENGCGIPKGAWGRLFEAFFTTKGMNGTGLGLWLTKSILDRHQGQIRIRTSTRAKRSGTAVVMFFPRIPSREGYAEAVSASGVPSS